MNEHDLKPGDIIFFENRYKKERGWSDYEYDYVDHVAIFAGFSDKGLPQIIHNFTSGKGHYHPTKPSGLCTTTLRALKDQKQVEQGHEDKFYDVRFHVFRGKDPALNELALKILQAQVRYQIPYDEKRLEEKLKREDEDGLDEDGFKRLGEESYRTEGIYRSIKYAARYPLPFVRTREDGVGRGLTCSMSVILAYQVAELISKKSVRSVAEDTTESPEACVSDKYAPMPKSTGLPDQFLRYLHAIRDPKSDRIDEHAQVSYTYWKDETCTPESFTHETFPVDAKKIGAAGLYCHMVDGHKYWQALGELDVRARRFSEEERVAERQRRSAHFDEVLSNWSDLARRRRASSVSPAASISPLGSAASSFGSQTSFVSEGIPWYSMWKGAVGTIFCPTPIPHEADTGDKPLPETPTEDETVITACPRNKS